MRYLKDLFRFINRLRPTNLRLENDLMIVVENMNEIAKEVPFVIRECLKRSMDKEPGYEAILNAYELTIYTPITEVCMWVANGPGFLKIQHHHWLKIRDQDRDVLWEDIQSILGISLPFNEAGHDARNILDLHV